MLAPRDGTASQAPAEYRCHCGVAGADGEVMRVAGGEGHDG